MYQNVPGLNHVQRFVRTLSLITYLLGTVACAESDSVSTSEDPLEDSEALPDDAVARPLDQGQILDMMPTSMDAHSPVDAFQGMDSGIAVDARVITDIASPVDALAVSDQSFPDMSPPNVQDASPPVPETLAERIENILTERGLNEIRTRLPIAEINDQSNLYPGSVNFEVALTSALDSFLNDGRDLESPRSLAQEVAGGPCLMADLTERVRCFLNRDTAYLELYGREGFAPENREPLEENWIFILRAESLSDHIQWAIIHRNGDRETYNYGFN